MDIYDQLLETHNQLRNDEMWLIIIKEYFDEHEVNNIDDFIDKLAEANIEGVVYSLLNEGENLLSLRDTDDWFGDGDDDYNYDY
jgi:flavodoxin